MTDSIAYSLSMRTEEQDSAQEDWISRLCLQCGLCCNGVLFADVRLQKGDDALALEAVGLKLKREPASVRFIQPCSCLTGHLCTIYENRPVCCRQFDCHTLKQARNGEVGKGKALRRIRLATEQSNRIKGLLRLLGNGDEHVALTKRYQAVMSQPIDLVAGEEHAKALGELILGVNDLMHCLHRDFLQ